MKRRFLNVVFTPRKKEGGASAGDSVFCSSSIAYYLREVEVELPSVDVLGDEVEPVYGGEGVLELQQERVLGLLQHVLLRERVRHLLLLDDDLLLQDLDGVQVVGRLLAAEDHLAERALAEGLDELEVFQRLRRTKYDRRQGKIRK